MSEPGIEPAGTTAQPPAAGNTARARQARRAVSAGGWCAAGAVGYVLGGPAVAAAGLVAAAVVACAIVVVLRSVLFGGSDPRSPFVRFMLVTCVLTGRPPGDYLPPGPGER